MSRAECPNCRQTISGSLAQIEAHVAGCCPETRSALPLADSRPRNESHWQQQVTDIAEAAGWHWHHVQNSRRSRPGFPDLVLWRERVVFAELKTQTGKTSVDQLRVLGQLWLAAAEAYVWRPDDIDKVREVLK